MPSPLFNEKFRRPSIGFAEVLKKGAGGMYREKDEYAPFMFRALVIAIDTEGGKLETPDGKPEGDGELEQRVYAPDGQQVAQYTITPTRGPRNPKNSVRARIVANNMDQFIDDDSLRTYWPLFPGVDNPSPGELVYVVFEDETMEHGLWVTKVPSNDPDETKNQMLMSEILKDAQNNKKVLFPDTSTTEKTTAEGAPIKEPNRLSKLYGF